MEKQTRKSKPRINLTGKQFGYLTALYYIKGGKWSESFTITQQHDKLKKRILQKA